jgi:hypothetical protein
VPTRTLATPRRAVPSRSAISLGWVRRRAAAWQTAATASPAKKSNALTRWKKRASSYVAAGYASSAGAGGTAEEIWSRGLRRWTER